MSSVIWLTVGPLTNHEMTLWSSAVWALKCTSILGYRLVAHVENYRWGYTPMAMAWSQMMKHKKRSMSQIAFFWTDAAAFAHARDAAELEHILLKILTWQLKKEIARIGSTDTGYLKRFFWRFQIKACANLSCSMTADKR